MIRLACLPLLLQIVLFASEAGASPMQVVMTGETNHLASYFNPANEPFTITISYDSNGVSSTSVDAFTQIYSLGKASELTIQVAGVTVYSLYQNVEAEIHNAIPQVPAGTQLIGASITNSFQPGTLSLVSTGIAPFSEPLSTLPFSFFQSSFQGGGFGVDDPTSPVYYSGIISEVSISPGQPVIVPEPAYATALVLLGGGVLLRKLRK